MLLTDLAYFSLRCTLSIIAAAATVIITRYSWQVYRSGQAWLLTATTGLLLGAATVLSVYDAVDNFLLRPHDPITLTSWLWFLLVDLPMPILAIRLVRVRKERDRLIAELSSLTMTDPLTGLLNRRGFVERATASIAQARRLGTPVSLAILDIDRFKAINDGYGHPAGDAVLQASATCLLTGRRAGDSIGRIGGEEFAILQFNCDEPMAAAGAERLRVAVRDSVLHPAGAERQVTLSGGVALIDVAAEPEVSLALAFKAADAALYAAKRGGRDRIMTATMLTASAEINSPG